MRVIGEDGQQLGIMSAQAALRLAEESDLDLVKISPTANPPVCKIMDYGKYKFELGKKEKESPQKIPEKLVSPLVFLRSDGRLRHKMAGMPRIVHHKAPKQG